MNIIYIYIYIYIFTRFEISNLSKIFVGKVMKFVIV